ncbi:hypothetical protein AX17_000345 [Amanita inopinata Kibby_2008]|nr:hypothetical protein AX17_000345 [Amanita inopinata Kibby_2008]
MVDSSSDPANLFGSPISSIQSPSKSDRANSLDVSRPTRSKFDILPPILLPEQKRLYKSPSQAALKLNVEIELNEVIGEYNDGNNLYYFARYDDGLAYKFHAKPFLKKYPNLVDDYRRKKNANILKPFDPSAYYVHPSSRVRTMISINTNKITTTAANYKTRLRRGAPQVSGSEDEYEGTTGETEQETSDDDYDSGIWRVPGRATRRNSILPFSPKKSRSQKVYVVDDSDENDSEAYALRPKSTRKKAVKVMVGLESSSSLSSDGSISSGYVPRRAPRVRKKPASDAKLTLPTYGRIRNISDLDCETDDEIAPLRRHRDICEKCHKRPAHELLHHNKKLKHRPSRKKPISQDELDATEDEVERLTSLGGWVRCLKCPIVAHWKCLSQSQRDEILRIIREKESVAQISVPKPDVAEKIKKRPGLDTSETTEFICGACTKGGICMGCMEVAIQPSDKPEPLQSSVLAIDNPGDADNTTDFSVSMPKVDTDEDRKPLDQLVFRCFTCKRLAHYEHLSRPSSLPDDSSIAEIAEYYQREKDWLCADCSSYIYSLDKILAWRPYPSDAVELPRSVNEPPNYKDPLPRKYLVKWVGRSYRRTEWVPHMWLLSTNKAKLKNFVANGARVALLRDEKKKKAQDIDPFDNGLDVRGSPLQEVLSLGASPDAEQTIPSAWKTVDRVLDILLWHPKQINTKKKNRNARIISDTEDSMEQRLEAERNAAFESGRQPSAKNTETILEWESREKRSIGAEDIGSVVWAFLKWQDLNYDEATWDSPPRPSEPGYDAFVNAFEQYVKSRRVRIPKYTASDLRQLEDRPRDGYRHHHLLRNATDLQLGQKSDLKLLPFQVDGFNWLCNNWWNQQPCILADEMGLGKTVQIATFLGNIATKFKAMPALVVVPNSTITNWVREFERWAPNLRVVPFYGEAKAREIIRKFELHHEKPTKGYSNAKFHILVATYESLLNSKDFTHTFKSEPRWEALIVDEGQRLKSDSSLLFKKLNELNSRHRIIMTGTPLNNNIRELFNLMNFLDPKEWHDLDALEKEYEELTEELVKQLHNRLRPYFLRRVKSEVLELPPKNEVIVPVSMAPLQREVYRSILSHNVDMLKGLTQPSNLKNTVTKRNINNILMQLRKCLQHPYLYAEGIEPQGLTPKETHEKLIDASAKLRLLKTLLPKLRDRGHRVLLFSQFVIALNVIEDFLQGEGFKFLRLDGNTHSFERQKGMDEFNRPGSDVFIYLLSTRAGGVGVNLYSADTVIIFDPDFNPHQDLQAISRAYRYGQQKTCLVFKLMVKDSAEERIMQIGKKKLVLDHLIVQKMDHEDSVGEDVQSILTYGAQTLFDIEQESRDTVYTDLDIEKLIKKTEQEGDKQEDTKEGALSFSFAKVWAADKDALEEIEEGTKGDSWTQTLQKITAERERTQLQEAVSLGRGVRRRTAAINKPNYYADGSPVTKAEKLNSKVKSRSVVSDTSSYVGSGFESGNETEASMSMAVDLDSLADKATKDRKLTGSSPKSMVARQRTPAYGTNTPPARATEEMTECGLCGKRHGDRLGECRMTDRSESLAQFREMLILHAEDEPWDERSTAIRAIDETLYQRGHLSLIAGQPLHPLPASTTLTTETGRRLNRQEIILERKKYDDRLSGLSKRPASPVEDSTKKRLKPSVSSCPICRHSPHHLVKDCPIVAEGPKSIAQQIRRLEGSSDVAVIQTVDILRKIMNKQKRRDME